MSESTAEAAPAPAPSAYPGSETLEQTIERIQKAADAAKAAKETADSRFAELDGHLTALRNLRQEADRAEKTYSDAYDRLTIDQQDFHDYYESEKESLENLLCQEGVDAVEPCGRGNERASGAVAGPGGDAQGASVSRRRVVSITRWGSCRWRLCLVLGQTSRCPPRARAHSACSRRTRCVGLRSALAISTGRPLGAGLRAA